MYVYMQKKKQNYEDEWGVQKVKPASSHFLCCQNILDS